MKNTDEVGLDDASEPIKGCATSSLDSSALGAFGLAALGLAVRRRRK